jgi:hypothetical protein
MDDIKALNKEASSSTFNFKKQVLNTHSSESKTNQQFNKDINNYKNDSQA